MCVGYVRMEGHQALPISPEESSEFIYGQTPIHSIDAPVQSEPQPPPQVVYPLFMQEFIQIMREAT